MPGGFFEGGAEMGLGAKTSLQCDLRHGCLADEDHLFGFVDPLAHHIFVGGAACAAEEYGVQVAGGYVQVGCHPG